MTNRPLTLDDIFDRLEQYTALHVLSRGTYGPKEHRALTNVCNGEHACAEGSLWIACNITYVTDANGNRLTVSEQEDRLSTELLVPIYAEARQLLTQAAKNIYPDLEKARADHDVEPSWLPQHYGHLEALFEGSDDVHDPDNPDCPWEPNNLMARVIREAQALRDS